MQVLPAHFFTPLRDAWRWWIGELGSLVPRGVRELVSGGRGRLLLIVDESGSYLAHDGGARREALGRVELEAERDGGIAAALGRRRGDAAAVVVHLPADQALRSMVALPLAAEKNLDHVIGYEFERLTPFRREDVYYAYRVVRRDTEARRLHLELTVVPRARAQEVLRHARRLGLRVVGLEAAGPANGAAGSHNLLPLAERPPSPRRVRLALGGLAGIAALLAIAAASIPFVQMQSRIDALTTRLDEVKRQAQASGALQKQIEAERRDGQFLVARKRQMPTVTELLATLTHIVPDDTWLLLVQFNASQLRISGYSPSATGLLNQLAQSSIYADPAFVSSVTQDVASKRERFDISARIVKRDDPRLVKQDAH